MNLEVDSCGIISSNHQDIHVERGDSSMLVDQFSCLGEGGKDHLIGILPERRRSPERITNRPIINWAREVIGNGCHGQRIHFVQINQGAMQSSSPAF
jgi:hypothetical protein